MSKHLVYSLLWGVCVCVLCLVWCVWMYLCGCAQACVCMCVVCLFLCAYVIGKSKGQRMAFCLPCAGTVGVFHYAWLFIWVLGIGTQSLWAITTFYSFSPHDCFSVCVCVSVYIMASFQLLVHLENIHHCIQPFLFFHYMFLVCSHPLLRSQLSFYF